PSGAVRHLQYRDDRLVSVDRERRNAEAYRSPGSLCHKTGGTLCNSKLRNGRRSERSRKRSSNSKPERSSPLAKSRKKTSNSTSIRPASKPRRVRGTIAVRRSFANHCPDDT